MASSVTTTEIITQHTTGLYFLHCEGQLEATLPEAWVLPLDSSPGFTLSLVIMDHNSEQNDPLNHGVMASLGCQTDCIGIR